MNTVTVPFHGDALYIVYHNGEPYTPMKPIVKGMGMDWMGQLTKLRQRFSSTVEEIPIAAEDGKRRNHSIRLRSGCASCSKFVRD
ncbi:hypothetical protein H0L72_002840 [Salmonella enterica]|nr:hypothetical protein [Salmonella enterica]